MEQILPPRLCGSTGDAVFQWKLRQGAVRCGLGDRLADHQRALGQDIEPKVPWKVVAEPVESGHLVSQNCLYQKLWQLLHFDQFATLDQQIWTSLVV